MEEEILAIYFFRMQTSIFVIHPISSDKYWPSPFPLPLYKIRFRYRCDSNLWRSDAVVRGITHINAIADLGQSRIFTAGVSSRHAFLLKRLARNIDWLI